MVTRPRIIALGLVVGLTLLSCTDQSLLGPTDAQLAKGGVPGAPGDSPDAVELLEYYIFHRNDSNFVHILAKGTFPHVNLNVVQDYIFNGIRDDDYSIYYEYTTAAPLPIGQESLPDGAVWETDPTTGALHIDIPWNGETWYDVYSDDGMTWISRETTSFPDFPHTKLDVKGGDPYAFDIRFQMENGDYIAGFQPQGIVLGGIGDSTPVMLQPAHAAFHDTVTTIYSYATFSGASGTPIFIDQIIVDETSIACEVKTIRERVDNVKSTRDVTEVSVRAQVILSDGAGVLLRGAWIDVMLATGSQDDPEFLDSFITSPSADAWADGWAVTTRFETAVTTFQLMLAVPYVYAEDLQNQMVYDPSGNNPNGNDGWSTYNAGPINTPGTFPYAITEPFTVNCGN